MTDTDNNTEYAALISEILKSSQNNELLGKLVEQQAQGGYSIAEARIPAPLNITEIGGYFNLMMKLQRQQMVQTQMIQQMLASILGLRTQNAGRADSGN